jgi:hypothetical protein
VKLQAFSELFEKAADLSFCRPYINRDLVLANHQHVLPCKVNQRDLAAVADLIDMSNLSSLCNNPEATPFLQVTLVELAMREHSVLGPAARSPHPSQHAGHMAALTTLLKGKALTNECQEAVVFIDALCNCVPLAGQAGLDSLIEVFEKEATFQLPVYKTLPLCPSFKDILSHARAVNRQLKACDVNGREMKTWREVFDKLAASNTGDPSGLPAWLVQNEKDLLVICGFATKEFGIVDTVLVETAAALRAESIAMATDIEKTLMQMWCKVAANIVNVIVTGNGDIPIAALEDNLMF